MNELSECVTKSSDLKKKERKRERKRKNAVYAVKLCYMYSKY